MTAEDVIDNKTLFSNFEEAPTSIECDVKGTIPSWLHGALMRQGTGMFDLGNTTYNHWFDGLAYLQKYTFNEGKTTYMAKLLKGTSYTENTNANRIVVTEFGTASFPDPCKNIFSKFFNSFTTEKESDNCNVDKYVVLHSNTAINNTIKRKPSTLEGLSVEQMRSDNVFGENDDFRSYLHRMVVPLTVPADAKEGDDLLKNYHNKKNVTCTAVLAEDGKVTTCTAVLTQDGKVHLSPGKTCTAPFEFPQINYSINTKNYKYCYGAVIQKAEPDNSAIVKANTTNNTFICWKKDKKSFFPTEPIFVAKPGSTEEDDGV
uniref:Beta-carotene oxygenase 2 n=1 Tax=Rhabditophanes sp. KR3021 TaxID=114890 RepID=A0AC35UIB4_9BILA